jgi:hypothetical protein
MNNKTHMQQINLAAPSVGAKGGIQPGLVHLDERPATLNREGVHS